MQADDRFGDDSDDEVLGELPTLQAERWEELLTIAFRALESDRGDLIPGAPVAEHGESGTTNGDSEDSEDHGESGSTDWDVTEIIAEPPEHAAGPTPAASNDRPADDDLI